MGDLGRKGGSGEGRGGGEVRESYKYEVHLARPVPSPIMMGSLEQGCPCLGTLLALYALVGYLFCYFRCVTNKLD